MQFWLMRRNSNDYVGKMLDRAVICGLHDNVFSLKDKREMLCEYQGCLDLELVLQNAKEKRKEEDAKQVKKQVVAEQQRLKEQETNEISF